MSSPSPSSSNVSSSASSSPIVSIYTRQPAVPTSSLSSSSSSTAQNTALLSSPSSSLSSSSSCDGHTVSTISVLGQTTKSVLKQTEDISNSITKNIISSKQTIELQTSSSAASSSSSSSNQSIDTLSTDSATFQVGSVAMGSMELLSNIIANIASFSSVLNAILKTIGDIALEINEYKNRHIWLQQQYDKLIEHKHMFDQLQQQQDSIKNQSNILQQRHQELKQHLTSISDSQEMNLAQDEENTLQHMCQSFVTVQNNIHCQCEKLEGKLLDYNDIWHVVRNHHQCCCCWRCLSWKSEKDALIKRMKSLDELVGKIQQLIPQYTLELIKSIPTQVQNLLSTVKLEAKKTISAIDHGVKQILTQSQSDLLKESYERLQDWKGKGEYIKTNAFDLALQQLSRNRVIVIKGNPGSGKTALAAHLAQHIADTANPQHKNIYCYSTRHHHKVKDLLSNVHRLSPTVIIFDDAFGSSYYDSKIGMDWVENLGQIQQLVDPNSHVTLICTSRTYILNELNDKYSNVSNEWILHDAVFELKHDLLTVEDRQRIIQSHLVSGDYTSQHKDIITSYLPQLCQDDGVSKRFLPETAFRFGLQRFTTEKKLINITLLKDAIKFFIHHTDYLIELYQRMSNDPVQLLTLELLFFNMDHYEWTATMKGQSKMSCLLFEHHNASIVNMESIRTKLQAFNGNILVKQKFKSSKAKSTHYWSFRHASLFDGMGQYLCKHQSSIFETFIQTAPMKIIYHSTVSKEVNYDHERPLIIITKDMMQQVVKRINSEIQTFIHEIQLELANKNQVSNPLLGALLRCLWEYIRDRLPPKIIQQICTDEAPFNIRYLFIQQIQRDLVDKDSIVASGNIIYFCSIGIVEMHKRFPFKQVEINQIQQLLSSFTTVPKPCDIPKWILFYEPFFSTDEWNKYLCAIFSVIFQDPVWKTDEYHSPLNRLSDYLGKLSHCAVDKHGIPLVDQFQVGDDVFLPCHYRTSQDILHCILVPERYIDKKTMELLQSGPRISVSTLDLS